MFPIVVKTTYINTIVYTVGKVVFLTGLLQYLTKKNMSLFVQKFCGDNFLSKSVSGYFKIKQKKFFSGPTTKVLSFLSNIATNLSKNNYFVHVYT